MGRRYFFHDLVWRKNLDPDRWISHSYFYFYCSGSRCLQWSGTCWLDELIMRFTEIFLSIPTLLLIILLQAIMGDANILSLSFVIGVTSWTSIAKVVRTEVRQIRNSEYIIAAKCMGAGFFRVLWKHLVPNFFSSIMFMVVMNVRTAMISEATLSFYGNWSSNRSYQIWGKYVLSVR